MKSVSKLLIDIGPLAVFFIFYTRSGLQEAILPLMIATVIAVIISYILEKRIPIMPTLGAGIVLVFGGLTIYFNDETFIKMKPTIIQLAFGVVLLAGLKFNLIFLQKLLGKAINLQEHGWKLLTIRISIFFFLRYFIFCTYVFFKNFNIWTKFFMFLYHKIKIFFYFISF